MDRAAYRATHSQEAIVNSLWVILLDTSGSMGAGFSGKDEGPGLTETSPYSVKLDAAKDYVLRQIMGITRGDIAVVAFASQAHLVCKGRPEDVDQFRAPIQELFASGTTNIAAALMFALTELGDLSIYKYIDFVVVSDGLSTEGDPIVAAQRCAESPFRIRINTILIDPTRESIQIAVAISEPSGGATRPVTSSATLAQAFDTQASLYQAELRRQEQEEEARSRKEQEEARFQNFITGMATFVGLSVAITGFLVGMVERPFVVFPLLVSGLAIVAAGYLLRKAFIMEQPNGLYYRGPHESDLGMVKPIYKYSRKLRVYSSIGAIAIIILAVLLIFFTYYRV